MHQSKMVPMLSMVVFVLFCFGKYMYIVAEKGYSTPSSWSEATAYCFEHGGRPAALSDIMNSTDKQTYTGPPVWTADYAVLSNTTFTNSTDMFDGLFRECRYTIIEMETYPNMARNITYTSFATKGKGDFIACSEKQYFVCFGGLFPTIVLSHKTWSDANKFCQNQNKTLTREKQTKPYQFAYFTRPDRSITQPVEVWTDETRFLQLLSLTDINFTVAGMIEKVGVYDNNGSFHLVKHDIHLKLRSICIYDDDTYSTSLYSFENKVTSQWVPILATASCIIFVAFLFGVLVCYIIRRKRQRRDMFHNMLGPIRDANHEGTEAVYANSAVQFIKGPKLDENIVEYELGRSARRSVSNPGYSYDAAYSSATQVYPEDPLAGGYNIGKDYENNRIEPMNGDNLYDNNNGGHPNASEDIRLNIYDRANYEDGEPLYD